MGEILNYVFQGEIITKGRNITIIEQLILLKSERYDKEIKRYKPFIEQY